LFCEGGYNHVDCHGTAGDSKSSNLFFAAGLEMGVLKPDTVFEDITGISKSCSWTFTMFLGSRTYEKIG
jgi:hypothetical protein